MKLPTLLYTAIILSCAACTNKTAEFSAVHLKDTVTVAPVKDTVIVKDSTITKERLYDNLSYTHNYKLTYLEHYKGKEDPDTHYWTITVYDKNMKPVDSIVQPVFMYFAGLIDFSTARSYLTGVNRDKQVADNYAGDFIVADFNFDNKNDFAIINDMGGNGGTFYSYYLQQDKDKYVEDRFLTDSVTYFPAINKANRTLTTLVHAWSCGNSEDIYTLQGAKWKHTGHRLINNCKDKKKK